MNQHGAWGGGSGWAASADQALSRFYGNGGTPTPQFVQGYFSYAWAGTGRENIKANYSGGIHAGQGYNVSYSLNANIPTVGSQFITTQQMLDLLNSGNSSMAASVAPFALGTAAVDGPVPVGDVIGGLVLAGAAIYDITQRVYITYTLTNGSKTYSGRSSGYGNPYSILWQRYSSHHMKSFGYGNPQLDVAAQGYPLGRDAIRGREQQLIDFYGGVGDPNVGNSIRGVWYYNPSGPYYHQMSNYFFGPLAPYTGAYK